MCLEQAGQGSAPSNRLPQHPRARRTDLLRPRGHLVDDRPLPNRSLHPLLRLDRPHEVPRRYIIGAISTEHSSSELRVIGTNDHRVG